MKRIQTDVLVIGAGAAGLVSALELAPLNVVVLAKSPVGEGSSSSWAQGGIAAALGADDHPLHHKRDTLNVAGGLACEEAVHVVTNEGPQLIEALIKWGVNFDRNFEGDLSLSQEAAHSFRRVLHANGDSTGKEMMRALGQALGDAENISLHSNLTAYELVMNEGRIAGALAHSSCGETVFVQASSVVLATGGIGNLFGFTTNPEQACGEGLAMAARIGAGLVDLEFVQFHPTAIDMGVKPMPLATEALRGEGATLIDQRGLRFLLGVHADGELGPRDVVARAIWRRIKSGDKVYLDCREAVGQNFPKHFPTVWAYCQEVGLDPRVDAIPVTPAAHYHMGGVDVNLQGRTSVSGLWAVGEVACTGVHGANRLASNSLLEAVVFGRRCAHDILLQEHVAEEPLQVQPEEQGTVDLSETLAQIMYGAAGVERNEAGLYLGLGQVLEWENKPTAWTASFRNKLCTAKMILACALERQESRGGHFRSDYPEVNPARAIRNHSTLNEIDAFIRGLNLGADIQRTVKTCQTQA